MCTINEDLMIYSSWNTRCDRQKLLSFWTIFCPFSPLTTQKIKILNLEKIPGDIIILHICIINDNHIIMVLEIWSTTERIFCHSGQFFALLTPRKSKFWKNEKKHLKILSFYKRVPKITVIWCMALEIWSAMDRFLHHFGPFFALLPT